MGGDDDELAPEAPLPSAVGKPVVDLTAAQARRIALAAQGFGRARPEMPTQAQANRVIDRLALLQIDSVNVLARAHTVPLFSRLGPYDPALLDKASYGGRRRRLFEYWGHEASLIRADLQPLLRWRMARAARGEGIYGSLARFCRERPEAVAAVLARVEAEGPVTARDLGAAGDAARGRGGWWGWSDTKHALEFLFWAGLLTTATRRGGFERVYDLPERVLPRAVVETPTPTEAEAQRGLLLEAARALGVATERDLRDYFRLDPADARPRLVELVEHGALLPARVKGWSHAAYLHPDAARPGRIRARALVSPFDPLVWERSRTERLFGVRYRLEIYTPAHKREHGYYVLPFLLGDRLVARLDLKADRAAGRLVIKAAHADGGVPADVSCPGLAEELREMARWQGLTDIACEGRGSLAAPLSAAL